MAENKSESELARLLRENEILRQYVPEDFRPNENHIDSLFVDPKINRKVNLLINAAVAEDIAAIKILLANGADSKYLRYVPMRHQQALLDMASRNRDLYVIKELMKNAIVPKNINNVINKETNETLLTLAVEARDYELIDVLLKHDADPNVSYFSKPAYMVKYNDLARSIGPIGPDVEDVEIENEVFTYPTNQRTPLVRAIEMRDNKIIGSLLNSRRVDLQKASGIHIWGRDNIENINPIAALIIIGMSGYDFVNDDNLNLMISDRINYTEVFPLGTLNKTEPSTILDALLRPDEPFHMDLFISSPLQRQFLLRIIEQMESMDRQHAQIHSEKGVSAPVTRIIADYTGYDHLSPLSAVKRTPEFWEALKKAKDDYIQILKKNDDITKKTAELDNLPQVVAAQARKISEQENTIEEMMRTMQRLMGQVESLTLRLNNLSGEHSQEHAGAGPVTFASRTPSTANANAAAASPNAAEEAENDRKRGRRSAGPGPGSGQLDDVD